MRRIITAAVVVAVLLAGCGDDDDGGGSGSPSRTFDDSGMDQFGCSRDEVPADGSCEPNDCLADAQERMDEASARDDTKAYNQAVEDANENCD